MVTLFRDAVLFLQRGTWAVALFLLVRGQAAHGVLVAVFLSVPLLRCLFSSQYRRQIAARFQEDTGVLQSAWYPGPLPWRPALLT